jgi:uncharacterized protein (DUF2267 family)
MTGAAAAAATSALAIGKEAKEIMSVPIENVLGSTHTETPTSRPPPSPAREATRSTTAVAERQSLQERVGQAEAREGRAVSEPTRLQGQALNYREFIRAVQESGAMDSAAEAEAAARATLSGLAGCISWPQAQNLAAWLPKPLRQLVSSRSFESSLSRFASQSFLEAVAAEERVSVERAARDARAVLLALDETLPTFITEQLHLELASLWAPLTHLPVAFRDRV